MGIVSKTKDQQGVRIQGVGSFNLIVEDWMKTGKDKNTKVSGK